MSFLRNAISGLSDFGVLYENARLMLPVPLELQHVVSLVLAAVLPFLPLVFLVMPAREVLRTLAATAGLMVHIEAAAGRIRVDRTIFRLDGRRRSSSIPAFPLNLFAAESF